MKLVIYAIHSEIVASRRANVTGLVDALKKSSLFEDVAVTFVADAEPGTVSQDTVTKVTNFSRIPDGDAPEYFNSLLAPLHVRHVSNVLKHVAALRAIAGQFSTDEDTFYMVVEDDVVYGDRIAPMLHELLGNLPAGFDLTLLGLPAPKGSDENSSGPKTCGFAAVYNVSPVCDSYVVSRKGAAALAAAMLPLKFACNVQLSLAVHTLKLNAHFSRPNLFIDGSKLGLFVSAVDANNQLILNSEYFAAKEVVDRPGDEPLSREDLECLGKLFETMRFKQHPDVMYLLGRLERRLGNLPRANELYAACFTAYRNNNAVLNNTNGFLKSYIDLCRATALA